MTLAQGQVHGETVSEAWLNAVQVVNAAPERRLFHLVTRVSDPVTEEPRVRTAVDSLLRQLDLAPVDTVANTIFPAKLAAASDGPGELAERYRRMYPTLRRLHKSNRRGTYFGRIVSHPAAGGDRDQLADLIERLKTELRTPRPKSARYEVNVTEPGELATADGRPAGEFSEGGPVHIYAAGKDTSPMGFPCLSFCSFQLDGDALHMVAQYRYQYLIERGYGNYLGLGQLLGYVCAAVGLRPGQLTIIAGVAAVESARYRVAWLVKSARP